MRKYLTVNSFHERNREGEHTGRKPKPSDIVELSKKEAIRLIKAGCVIPIETAEIYRSTALYPERDIIEKRKNGG